MRGRNILVGIAAITMMAASASAQPSVAAPASAVEARRLEAQVLAELNAARSDPISYSAGLKTYRGFFHAKIVVVPGMSEHFQTEEGVVPVDEAIGFLETQANLTPLESAPLLTATAADHVADQGASGGVGHYGADGSTPGERAVRRGGGKGVAEVIAYGGINAIDVVRQLIIDDGVADRGHRILMFSQHLRYAGVSCGPHPQFRTMCVIDMADTPDGRNAGAPRSVRVAQRDGSVSAR